MLYKLSRKKIIFILSPIFFVVAFVLLTNYSVQSVGRNEYCSLEFPQKDAALVLGARVYENGRMSDVFRDRAEVAVSFYEAEKVQKILVSGDHGTEEYDEVNAAKDFLLSEGVKPEDIFLDHAGFDTYDSVYRAKEIFGVESMVIATQDFHLPRALYIAEELGIDACGASSDLHEYRTESQMEFREIFARSKAWLDVFLKSKPKYLGEEILISGDGQATWD